MLIDAAFIVIGILSFLFMFWRRLKEDYITSQIFTSAFYILIGILVASLLSRTFFSYWWFWLSMVLAMLSMFLGILRFKLSLMETFEASILGSLFIFGLFLLRVMMMGDRLAGFGAFIIFLLISLFFFLDSHYRKFSWYKSGRVGFTGLAIFGLFFLIRAIVAVSLNGVISFVGNIDAYLSGVISFISFLALFNLARQKI